MASFPVQQSSSQYVIPSNTVPSISAAIEASDSMEEESSMRSYFHKGSEEMEVEKESRYKNCHWRK